MTTTSYQSKMQQKVAEFHTKYALTQCGYAKFMAEDWLDRLRLIDEERAELGAAACRDSIEEIIDSICDLLYVVLAVPVALNIDIQPFFDEVHRSNMTKDGDMDSGKLTKGPGFVPPNLLPLLKKEGLL